MQGEHTTGLANIQPFSKVLLTWSPGGGIHAINISPCQSLFVMRVEFIHRS
jgi:hypothetical protein